MKPPTNSKKQMLFLSNEVLGSMLLGASLHSVAGHDSFCFSHQVQLHTSLGTRAAIQFQNTAHSGRQLLVSEACFAFAPVKLLPPRLRWA